MALFGIVVLRMTEVLIAIEEISKKLDRLIKLNEEQLKVQAGIFKTKGKGDVSQQEIYSFLKKSLPRIERLLKPKRLKKWI